MLLQIMLMVPVYTNFWIPSAVTTDGILDKSKTESNDLLEGFPRAKIKASLIEPTIYQENKKYENVKSTPLSGSYR